MPRGSKPGERRGGRKKGVPNKATAEIKSFAQKYGEEAINGLVKIMRSSESDQAKVSAAREILDRAYGKASQPLSGDAENPVQQIIEIVTGVPRSEPDAD